MFSVIKLSSETLTEHYNPNLFNHFYETFPDGFLVAEELKRIIGFIVGLEAFPGTLKILMLAVKKEYRKQGIGSALLNNFFEVALAQNIKYMELEVRRDNNQAIRFYQKQRFEIVETISKFYQNGEDAYIMRRSI